MKSLRAVLLLSLITFFAPAQGRSDDLSEPPSNSAPAPRVLQPLEPPDNRIVTLPGPRTVRPVRESKPAAAPAHPPAVPAPVATQRPVPAAPALPAPAAAPTVATPELPESPLVDTAQPVPPQALQPILSEAPVPLEPTPPSAPAAAEPPGPAAPSDPEPAPALSSAAPSSGNVSFDGDAPAFLQKQIGWWSLTDARSLLGAPVRQRSALDDNQSPNGQIYAFPDPSGRYKELELDFDAENGNLRTVFLYPWNMTWEECRTLFGTNVNTTKANKGRIFYSYINRRLDVLVSPEGQVISLGLY